jgi:DNA-binding transcriptional ArsR family regulator
MKDFLNMTKALSDEGRVRALLALAGGELCVCQIIDLLGLAPSTVSKHMAVLHQAGLVETRKEGKYIYYSLAGPDAPPHVRAMIDAAREALAKDKQVRDDARRLKAIRKMDLEKLCCHYRT